MSITSRRIAGLGLAALIVALDQWIKWYLLYRTTMRAGPIEVFPFFTFRHIQNLGVSLGMLTADSLEMRWVLVVVTSLIAIAVLVWIMRERKLAEILPLGLILGGAIGNICDRARYGHVVDYADLHFGSFRPFLIFNLADAAITIGVVIILVRSLLSREKPGNAAKTAPEA